MGDPNLPAGGALEMLQLPNPVCAIASPSVRWSAAPAISLLFATPVLRKRWNSNVAMTTAVCAVEEMIANSVAVGTIVSSVAAETIANSVAVEMTARCVAVGMIARFEEVRQQQHEKANQTGDR